MPSYHTIIMVRFPQSVKLFCDNILENNKLEINKTDKVKIKREGRKKLESANQRQSQKFYFEV